MCYNFTMSAKGYFSNLQNRYSANFIAIASCISLVYAIVFHTIDYLPRNLKWGYNLYGWDFPFAYWFISTSILGFIVLFLIFPLSITFCLLLKNKNNHRNFLYVTSFILICIFLYFLFGNYYELATDINSVVSIVATYFHMYKILIPIFISIPFLCIADSQNNILISNTNLTNNKIYKCCIYFFFYYFWLQYIPFVLGLLLYFFVGLH